MWARCVAGTSRYSEIDGQNQCAAREEEEESSEDTKSDLGEKHAAREEEEESSKDAESNSSVEDVSCGHAEATEQAEPDANGIQTAIQVLLENLRCGRAPLGESAPAPFGSALNLL